MFNIIPSLGAMYLSTCCNHDKVGLPKLCSMFLAYA
uniref:Uncharacterized protein n=1 Tax=Rhizophora mucronata TaxID=61149 RepID=A0A2P2P5Y0_RHIMU